jgi:broad specificity phosphatase PhoE
MRILLLRHGQTPYNLDGTIDTRLPGAALTSLGSRQAAAVPAAIDDERVDRIYVSTLVRTALTAGPLSAARGLTPVVLDGLREIEGGELELRGDREAQHLYLETVFGWARGELDRRVPGAESGQDFFARYDDAIQLILAGGGDSAVAVSHGSAIRTWVGGRALGAEPEFAGTHQLDNTGMAVLEGDSLATLRLVVWRSHPVGGHLLTDPTAIDSVHDRSCERISSGSAAVFEIKGGDPFSRGSPPNV